VYRTIKRVFDLVLSLTMLLILLPLLLIISITIKIDSKGSIIFTQKRLGKNRKPFYIYKFRTMLENAEEIGTGLDSYHDDIRVTKVGKFLRNTSLDELPQLINILKGDMSFVGPRPPVYYHPYYPEDYPEYALSRFKVKPGVTGWAQINGRNELTWDQKFTFDNYYIKNVGLCFDISIFVKTIFKVLKREGSYDIERKKENNEK